MKYTIPFAEEIRSARPEHPGRQAALEKVGVTAGAWLHADRDFGVVERRLGEAIVELDELEGK